LAKRIRCGAAGVGVGVAVALRGSVNLMAGVRRRSMFGMIGSKHVGMAHLLSLGVGLQISTKEVHRARGINGHR
jgi:hypothetical protein